MKGSDRGTTTWALSVIVASLCLMCVVFTLVRLSEFFLDKKGEDVIVDDSKDIVTQVGHVDMSNKDNLELLFEDKDNDISYYRRIDKSYVVEGDTAYFSDDSTAKIVGTDVYGFYTEYISSIVPGMSGTAVRNEDGEVVGYVEQILNKNVYCIWK